MRWRRLILAVPPIVMCLTDAVLTLAGQSAAYWGGNLSDVNEISPDMNRLLGISPFTFLGGVILWIALFTIYIYAMPSTIALAITLTVTLGHSIGSATWVIWWPPYGYQLTMLGCVMVGILVTVSLTLSQDKGPSESAPRGFTLWQWILTVVGIAIPVYVFMIPH